MKLRELSVPGAFVLEMERITDERGWFARSWDFRQLETAGLKGAFVQQSFAWNAIAGTVRGMHLAVEPAREVKIVRCTRGAAFDVILDARPESPTFGSFAALRLDDRNHHAVYVPAGCAHGYQTLVDETEMLYDISEEFRAECASGVAYDDKRVAIPWPLPVTVLSDRDRDLPSLSAASLSR